MIPAAEARVIVEREVARQKHDRLRFVELTLRLAGMRLKRRIRETTEAVSSLIVDAASSASSRLRSVPKVVRDFLFALIRSKRTRNFLVVIACLAVLFDLVVASIKVGSALQENLDLVRNALFTSAQVAAILLVGVVAVMLVLWLSGSDEGMRIMPFEDATGGSVKFTAIADALAAEMSRIRDVRQQPLAGASVEVFVKGARTAWQVHALQITGSLKSTLPPFTPRSEDISYLANVATVGIGQTTVSLGAVLLTLKRFWPVGANATVIGGSLQRYGSMVRLVARIEGRHLVAVAAERWMTSDDDLAQLVRELAFRIELRMAKTERKDWRSLMHYTDACEAYARFLAIHDGADLERARVASLQARATDPGYQEPCVLLYTLGNLFNERASYEYAEELYRKACELDTRDAVFNGKGAEIFAWASNGRGIALSNLQRWEEAATAFQSAASTLPQAGAFLHNVALAMERLERWERALFALDLAKEADHFYPADALRRAVCLWRMADDGYVQAFNEASELAKTVYVPEGDAEFASTADVHRALGHALRHRGLYKEAADAYLRALADGQNGHPPDVMLHIGLAAAHKQNGDLAAYEEQVSLVRTLPAPSDDYNRACVEAICGNADVALQLLAASLEKKQVSREWAAEDPDFDDLRHDSRYVALVSAISATQSGAATAHTGGEVF